MAPDVEAMREVEALLDELEGLLKEVASKLSRVRDSRVKTSVLATIFSYLVNSSGAPAIEIIGMLRVLSALYERELLEKVARGLEEVGSLYR